MTARPNPAEFEKGTSLWKDAWHRLRQNKVAVASGAFLIVMMLLCFVAAWFMTPPNTQNLDNQFASPSAVHWLGTDQAGRDLLSRILYGGQLSLVVGLVATAVAFCIGILYGGIAGYTGGRLDASMMRLVDVLYAIPFLVLVILLQQVFDATASEFSAWLIDRFSIEKQSTQDTIRRVATVVPLLVAISALGWLTLARITRAQVLAMKEQEFTQAARSLGLSPLRILVRHILPNTLGPAIVYVTLTVPAFIMYEATLSFLGLGIKAPNSSWGVLIKDGANYMETQPMLLILPGLFFTSTLFAFNFLGDGLRDALDPKAAKD
jgi:oligopeptide transport system permease protein